MVVLKDGPAWRKLREGSVSTSVRRQSAPAEVHWPWEMVFQLKIPFWGGEGGSGEVSWLGDCRRQDIASPEVICRKSDAITISALVRAPAFYRCLCPKPEPHFSRPQPKHSSCRQAQGSISSCCSADRGHHFPVQPTASCSTQPGWSTIRGRLTEEGEWIPQQPEKQQYQQAKRRLFPWYIPSPSCQQPL